MRENDTNATVSGSVTRFARVLRQIDVAKAQPELEIPSNAQNDHLSSKWSYPTKAHQTADTANALAEPNIFAIPTEIGRVVWVGPNQEVPTPIHEVRPIPRSEEPRVGTRGRTR